MKTEYNDETLNIVLDTISKKKQAIVFVNTKQSAEKTAEEISKKIKNIKHDDLSKSILGALSKPTKQCKRLSMIVEKGIAFHHSGLTFKQRELIEDSFRSRRINVICATPTLAAGVDLPAFRVVLKSLKRYGHRGLTYIPVLEYKQMAGRAGRPKYDNEGEAVMISTNQDQRDELENRYLYGEPEAIYSKLAVEPVLRTYVLSLIASGFVSTKETILEFFSKTLWAYQYGDLQKLSLIINKILGLLEEWELIIGKNTSDFVSAQELANEKYRATNLGRRIAELYIDPYTANYFANCLKKAASVRTDEYSFLVAICNTLEIRPQLRAGTKDHDKISEKLIEIEDSLLINEPSIYDDDYDIFSNAIKTAMFMYDWITESSEDMLLENYRIRPGEINSKLDTADWLLYSMEEIARIQSFKKLLSYLKKLRVRIKYGVHEELLPLLKFKGIGRVRARKLFSNKIKDVRDVKSINYMALAQILGQSIAKSIKEQVGEKVDPIKKRKRKGQINIADFN